jgi:hypothetical protein
MALPSTTAQGVEVAVVNQQLVVKGTGATNDILDVELIGPWHQVYSGSDDLQPGAGCVSQSARGALCPLPVNSIAVDGGEGDDLIGL